MRVGRHTRAVAVLSAAVLVIVASAVSGCGDWSASFESNDYYATWLESQPTGDQIANSAARTGDKDVDGILGAFDAIGEIEKADALQEDARAELVGGNAGAAADMLDEAIELRPDDGRYRRDRAMAAVLEGDAVTAAEQFAEEDRIAELNRHDTRPAYFESAIAGVNSQLEPLRQSEMGPTRDAGYYAVYTRLADLHQRAAEMYSELHMSDQVTRHLYRAEAASLMAEELADRVEAVAP